MPSIGTIVEGQSEAESLPLLLRRILHERLFVFDISVTKPFRVKRNQIVKENEIERAIRQLLFDREDVRAILVVLDSDKDCPVEIASSLQERSNCVTGLPVRVVAAQKEFESWFLGSKSSLRGIRGIRATAEEPPDPEGILGAKSALSRNMENGRRYNEVDDQPALVQAMDIDLALMNCRSFRKLVNDITYLCSEITSV